MAVLPRTVQDLLDFADQHGPLWVSVSAQVGLSASQSALFNSAANAARNDFNAEMTAESLRRAATLQTQTSVRELRRVGGDTIRLIKAFAEAQPKPNIVYQTAQIPPPAAPSPAPAPVQPTEMRAVLNPEGTITLRWKASNPGTSGTVYNIRRRVGSTGEFISVGNVGVKQFTDNTLPSVPSVQYVVTGLRGDRAGEPSSPFTVMFGVGGPGAAGVQIVAQYSGDAPANANLKQTA